MAPQPTSASVTETPCACNYLQRSADDPALPIRFDATTGEYQFMYREKDSECDAILVIYHCPFCGGAAPRSKRRLLFAVIPREEARRLAALLAPIRTLDDAFTAFGSPDFDDYSTTCRTEQDGSPPVTTFHRDVIYRGLSDVADVHLTEGRDGKAHWQLEGKLISQVRGQ